MNVRAERGRPPPGSFCSHRVISHQRVLTVLDSHNDRHSEFFTWWGTSASRRLHLPFPHRCSISGHLLQNDRGDAEGGHNNHALEKAATKLAAASTLDAQYGPVSSPTKAHIALSFIQYEMLVQNKARPATRCSPPCLVTLPYRLQGLYLHMGICALCGSPAQHLLHSCRRTSVFLSLRTCEQLHP